MKKFLKTIALAMPLLAVLLCSGPGEGRAAGQTGTGEQAARPDLTAAASTTAAPAVGIKGDAANAVIRKLPNGMTVILKKDSRFPLVSIRLFVNVGSSDETPDIAGISHVVEHMAFKGTEKYPKNAASALLQASGGTNNAWTSVDSTCYTIDLPASEWAVGLDVAGQLAFHPLFEPDALEIEKQVILSEIQLYKDDPDDVVRESLMGTAFAGTAYERPIIGFKDTVNALTSQNLKDYHARFYQPGAATLVVVGDIDPEAVSREALAIFGGLRNTESISLDKTIPLDALPAGPQVTVEQGPWKTAHIALLFPSTGEFDARSEKLGVLMGVLGGTRSSRLYRTLKYEKQLCLNIGAWNVESGRAGWIYIQAEVEPEKVRAFWEELIRELAALDLGAFTDEELGRVKLNIEDSIYLPMKTYQGLASQTAMFFRRNLTIDGIIDTVRGTDQNELHALAGEFITPVRMSAAIVMPAAGDGAAAGLPDAAWFKASLAAAWPSSGVPAKQAGVAESPATEVVDLGQGRTLVLMPDKNLPYTAVSMRLFGGDSLLSPKDQGLGVFTAMLLQRGAGSMSATQVDDFLTDRAADVDANSGLLSFSLTMSFPSRFAGDMFGYLRDCLAAPAMSEEEAARERNNLLAAIKQAEDGPTSLAWRRMSPFVFKEHPYGYLHLGEIARVAAFTAEDARSFWRKQAAMPWVVVVSGDFDREAVIGMCESLPKPSSAKPDVPAPVFGQDREMTLTLPGRAQAHYFLLFPTQGSEGEDAAGLDLLQTALTGIAGILHREYRGQMGLGYTITAFEWATRQAGLFCFYIGTDPDKLEASRMAFVRAVADLRAKPISEEDLAQAKKRMAAEYYMDAQTIDARASLASTSFILGLPLDDAWRRVEKAQKLTARDLQDLANKYFDKDKAYTITVRPE